MIPEKGKFYYINYQDEGEPEGSYFGPGRCVQIFDRDEAGNSITPLYEFEHPDNNGEMVLSLFYAKEVLMETSRP